jgi:hypothetical protein
MWDSRNMEVLYPKGVGRTGQHSGRRHIQILSKGMAGGKSVAFSPCKIVRIQIVNFRLSSPTCIVQILASTGKELTLMLDTSPTGYIRCKLWLTSDMNFISIYSLVVEKADDYFLFGTQKK